MTWNVQSGTGVNATIHARVRRHPYDSASPWNNSQRQEDGCKLFFIVFLIALRSRIAPNAASCNRCIKYMHFVTSMAVVSWRHI